MQNNIYKTLVSLGVCDDKTVIPFHNKVRDRDGILVLKDQKSGVIFLDKTSHMDVSHYESMNGFGYWHTDNIGDAVKRLNEDDTRRAKLISTYVKDKDYVDIGCGVGGVMGALNVAASSVSGVELQEETRNKLKDDGYTMYKESKYLPSDSFDVASLFHVLEHLTDPIQTLQEIHTSLKPGGVIVVEVPHARDVLLNLESFKDFSLWSEHLILHTRESLQKVLEVAGFTNIKIKGFQRHNLANHIGWLLTGKPSGQNSSGKFRENGIEEAYLQELNKNDKTDTLIAIACV